MPLLSLFRVYVLIIFWWIQRNEQQASAVERSRELSRTAVSSLTILYIRIKEYELVMRPDDPVTSLEVLALHNQRTSSTCPCERTSSWPRSKKKWEQEWVSDRRESSWSCRLKHLVCTCRICIFPWYRRCVCFVHHVGRLYSGLHVAV